MNIMKKKSACCKSMWKLLTSMLFGGLLTFLLVRYLQAPILLPDIPNRILWLLILWFLYVAFVFIEKSILALVAYRSAGEKGCPGFDCKALCETVLLVFVSPDYVFTAMNKKQRGRLTDDEIKDKQIAGYNIVNVILSGILAVLLFLMGRFGSAAWLLPILFFRLTSRSIEILVSFFFDVVRPSDRRSRLTKIRRICLALLSLFEVTLLVLGFFLTQPNGILWAVHDTISALLGLSFDADALRLETFVRVFGNLMAAFIVGFVVVTYLSSSSFYEGAPVLIASNGQTTIERKFERVRPKVYRVRVLEFRGQDLKVFFQGDYFGLSDFQEGSAPSHRVGGSLDDFRLLENDEEWLFLKQGKDSAFLALEDANAH